MDKKIFTEIPFNFEMEQLKETLQLRKNQRIFDKTEYIANEAKKLAKPKAIYIKSPIEERTDCSITLNGVVFESKILQANTIEVQHVFPFVITCGTEIEKISNDSDDIMSKFILDGVKTLILMSATEYISQQIKTNYGMNDIKYDNPGSLEDWEMKEQEKLFHLIGDVTDLIGVRLSNSFIMHPGKSVSGIYYETGGGEAGGQP